MMRQLIVLIAKVVAEKSITNFKKSQIYYALNEEDKGLGKRNGKSVNKHVWRQQEYLQ